MLIIKEQVMVNYINGIKFRELADFVYSPTVKHEKDYLDIFDNTLDIELLDDFNIIYTHIFYTKQLFDIIKDIQKRLILVTHNSDCPVDDSYDIPDNVIKWYSQNVDTINPKIESLPIGLSCNKWYPFDMKVEAIKNAQDCSPDQKLIYMNFGIGTYPDERQPLYDMMKGKSWVTTRMGVHGVDVQDYFNNIRSHKFVLCPRGSGIDCYRTWETLYVGSIPIEKRNINNQYFTDLPICFVDKWEDITEDFLNKEYDRIKGKKWDLCKLDFNYWEKRIRSSRVTDEFNWDTYTADSYKAQIIDSEWDNIISDFSYGINDMVFKDNLCPNHAEIYHQVYSLDVSSVFECGFGAGQHLINLHLINDSLLLGGCDISNNQLKVGIELFNVDKYPFYNNLSVFDFSLPLPEDAVKYDFVYAHAVTMHLSYERCRQFLINMKLISNKYIFLIEGLGSHDYESLFDEIFEGYERVNTSRYIDYGILFIKK